jgi:hypothetical protein
MKRTLIAAAGLALFAASGLAGAASWSVIVQPGVYGRVAIGGYVEAPQVYAPQPVVAIDNGYGEVVEEVVDPAYATDQAPVYLWVPEYQRLHWAQYCREYGAYGVPVYFVDDGWYRANVMRRNWTPEQRSWSQQQWLEHDRLARDRFERQRFEQQRYEQQQRWNDQRAWQERQQQRPYDDPDRMRWGSARGYVPFPQGNGQPQHPQPQPGGQWQQHGGGQWQQPGNGGHPGGNAGNGNGGYAGNAGYGGNPGNPLYGGRQGGNAGNGANAGNAGGDAGHGAGAGGAGSGGNPVYGGQPGGNGVGHGGSGNAYAGSQQPPSASQPHGSGRPTPIENVGERRGDDRGDRRGQGEARGAFERGHGGNRDR